MLASRPWGALAVRWSLSLHNIHTHVCCNAFPKPQPQTMHLGLGLQKVKAAIFVASSQIVGWGGWCSHQLLHGSAPNSQSVFQGGHGKKLPRLLIVQPRVHPRTILKAKLMEAMRLADALEGLRGDGENDSNSNMKKDKKKRESPFVLVQSPRTRSSTKRLRAGEQFCFTGCLLQSWRSSKN
jgi:hypothetical protein